MTLRDIREAALTGVLKLTPGQNGNLNTAIQKQKRNAQNTAMPVINRVDAFTIDDSKTYHQEWLAKSGALKKLMTNVGAPPAVVSSSTSRVVSSTGGSAPVERLVSKRAFVGTGDASPRRLIALESSSVLSLVPAAAEDHHYHSGPAPPSQAKLHAAQAMWSVGEKQGPALNFRQFKRTFKLKSAFEGLHAPGAVSSDEEDDDTVWGDREKAPVLHDDEHDVRLPTLNAKLATRIAQIKGGSVAKTMPVEVFLDEYSEELIHYLVTPAPKKIGNEPARRLALIRRGLRRNLGISNSMTRLIRLCILFSIVLASICIWLGFWILSLQDELADLQKMTKVLAVPPLRTVDMTLKQHIIQLSDSGTSVPPRASIASHDELHGCVESAASTVL